MTATGSGRDGQAVSLAAKVRFLSSPAAYPTVPAAVSVRETHMSFVFLVGGDVYKLKKPVMRGTVLDFTTLAAREADCREEVRLNRRLAPDVYRDVVPLTVEPDGGLALDGQGPVAEWLVRMRRLPRACLMDHAIAAKTLAPQAVDRLGGVLADFYAGLPPADIAPRAYLERFRGEQALNLDILKRLEFAVDGARLDRLAEAMERFLIRDGTLLEARVVQGRVVEGHGDLRPEHVCLAEPPLVIDCLEFNRFLRLVDPFEEIAFLGLECTRLGAGWVGPALRRILETRLRDRPGEGLWAFHTAFRACLRARLALAHLFEPRPRTPKRWPRLARAYLDLAEAALETLP